MTTVAVIGGGAAGLLAAGFAGKNAKVTLFEKMVRPGRKIMITGKGRCNLTNNCTPEEFLQNVPRNSKFLYSALRNFSPEDTMRFFEGLGVPLKTERGRRVFPVSDRSADIVDALMSFASENSVVFKRDTVKDIKQREDGVFELTTDENIFQFDRVIIATGGLSYPKTGSTGDGYRFAENLGHRVTTLRPSLVPLESSDHWCKKLQGLTLKNVKVKLCDKQRKLIFSELGEMIFTHFGVSGPLILSCSSHMNQGEPRDYILSVDLKPALSEEQLHARLLREFSENPKSELLSGIRSFLPQKMAPIFVQIASLDKKKKLSEVTRVERQKIVSLLKSLPISVSGFRPVEEAVVTSGGVDVNEVDPKTMESKIRSNLYFAGEILDIDGYTGGYNLQIAFSTGYAAGNAEAGE